MYLWAAPGGAYPTYSEKQIPTHRNPEGESVGYCTTCHGNFRATNQDDEDAWLRDEYISPADGKPWSEIYQEVEAEEPAEEIGLHDVHRHIILDKIGRSRCNTCHFGEREDRFRVFLDQSNGGDGLEPIGCVGCHGRNEDARPGAGLRQHHSNSGVNVCKTCHPDADPANYTPVGEHVSPSYYAAPNDVFVNKPTDPCNTHGEEDYAGGLAGLDNDGDGVYDKRDPDCVPIGPNENRAR
jgi:hypothetical protein